MKGRGKVSPAMHEALLWEPTQVPAIFRAGRGRVLRISLRDGQLLFEFLRLSELGREAA